LRLQCAMERQRERRGPRGRARARRPLRPCGSRCARMWAPPSSWLRDRERRRRHRRPGARRQRGGDACQGRSGRVVLNQTPFYGESGGQVGDTGVMTGDGVRFRVTDTQKRAGDVFVHSGVVEEGTLKPGRPVTLEVDHARRRAIRANHSATHLLHEALRQVLAIMWRRRDLWSRPTGCASTFHIPSRSALRRSDSEDIANEMVLQNSAVTTRLMAVDDAIASGAVPCSARNTATRCGSWPWGKAAMRSAGRSSCAAAPMCGARAISALVSVVAESAVGAGCAASRR